MKKRDKSGFVVMLGLIGMVKPLLGVMAIAIFMGCIGNLAATFITVLGGYAISNVLGIYSGMTLGTVFTVVILLAVMRGVLRYAEQMSNHYIAFKILARIRHQVFAVLRKLAPAKLDGKEKGNLISLITSDIELLEVFYAHTVSPIAIAFITSVFMSVYIGSMNYILGIMAAIFYCVVGILIPVLNSRNGQQRGRNYREIYGKLNTTVLDNLYGAEEILQYDQKENRLKRMADQTRRLESINGELKADESKQRIRTDRVIMAAGIITVIVSGYLSSTGEISYHQALIAIIAVMSSFGPTAALSALSNNLNQTLASGNRVLNLLEEEPVIKDIIGKNENCEAEIHCNELDFSYSDQNGTRKEVLKNFSAHFRQNTIHGILGKSGCGKSTLLKLLMRFYETDQGKILYGSTEVGDINTSALRKEISYVTQETFLFQDTIENNMKVANAEATREEVIEAAKKASIHDFIMTLPNGYDTKIKEAGSSLSGGERQRIGIARAFLHKSRIIFLDEPTSNIDSLNEGIVLRSLKNEKADKTIILVSHRKSTLGIADEVTQM